MSGRQLTTDPELEHLVPNLSADEYATLEASILETGIRDPIDVWEGTIIDGHNRYEICKKHGIDFRTRELAFRDKSEAMIWMIDNQRGRRNLTKQAWLDLGFKRAELLKPKAEANMSARKGNQPGASSQESDKLEPVDTLKEAADYAGVSRDTAAKYKRVMSDAPEETKQKVRAGETSINRAYQEIKQPSPEPEAEEPGTFWETEIEEEVELDTDDQENRKRQGRELALRFIEKIRKELSDVPDITKYTALLELLQWIDGETKR